MSSNVVQEPLSNEKSKRSSRDTGFSEPFSTDRNTTLPHPSANTGPNATLQSSDIPVSATNSRRRIGYRRSSSKNKNLNYGSIDAKDLERDMYTDIQYVDGTVEKKAPEELTKELTKERDENDELVGRDSGVSGLNERVSGDGERKAEDLVVGTPEKKKGFLSKMHFKNSHRT